MRHSGRRPLAAAGLTVMSLVVFGIAGRTAAFEAPQWAYPETPRDFRPDADDGAPKRIVGSTRAYTFKQIADLFAPPDWYPIEHPKMPAPVGRGRTPGVQACASCHLANGMGRPESASLAGLSVEYMTLELANFKTGARHSSVGESPMADIARALSPEERDAALVYYSRLPRTPWVTVVEADMVPKTRIVEHGLRIPLEPEDLEPLGQRIVEVPKDPARARLYDSHTPFIAYVPRGSIRRGRAFVSSGGAQTIGGQVIPGKAVACANCHGAAFRGMVHAPDSDVPVPPLAGRSPTYLLRQLYDVHSGARAAASTTLMKPIAAQMTLQEMIDAAAYLGSKL